MIISLSWTLERRGLTIDYRALESSMEEQERWNKEIKQVVDRLCFPAVDRSNCREENGPLKAVTD